MKTSSAYGHGHARAVTWIVCFAYGTLIGGAGVSCLLLGRPFDASSTRHSSHRFS
jgi:hypothetical protein